MNRAFGIFSLQLFVIFAGAQDCQFHYSDFPKYRNSESNKLFVYPLPLFLKDSKNEFLMPVNIHGKFVISDNSVFDMQCPGNGNFMRELISDTESDEPFGTATSVKIRCAKGQFQATDGTAFRNIDLKKIVCKAVSFSCKSIFFLILSLI